MLAMCRWWCRCHPICKSQQTGAPPTWTQTAASPGACTCVCVCMCVCDWRTIYLDVDSRITRCVHGCVSMCAE